MTGSLAETLAELADEIAVVVKSSGVGNLGDRTGGADEQGAGFIKAGFQDAQFRPLLGGVSALHVATR